MNADSAAQERIIITHEMGAPAVARDLILLTKPGIILLLLISTACPMVLAAEGRLALSTLLWALIGGALVSGSASCLNCIWDRDIDAVMERTKDRPMPAGRISLSVAYLFASVLLIAGEFVLAYYLNTGAALMALFGHVFYVVVYTMWLKRTTPQNIVIGGAAGAIPPLVGWMAVTGSVNLTAVYLFLVIFLWTPPHFWALALNKNSDYRRANVPMLPVVAGEQATHRQMLWYAILLLPASILLVFSDPTLGVFSLLSLVFLSLVFIYKIMELSLLEHIELRARKAWDIFGYSILYLAFFFLVLVIDSTIL